MTTLEAIEAIFTKVKAIFPEENVYKQEKPDDIKNDVWIAINSLPVVPVKSSQTVDLLQTATVNINIHVADLGKGRPNFELLSSMTNTLIVELPFEIGNITAYYAKDGLIREAEKSSHYVNIQLTANFLNQ